MKQYIINQHRLKQVLEYNQNTGIFTRVVKTAKNTNVGDIAGHTNKTNGYVEIMIDRVSYYAHRLAWLYVYGEMPKNNIDHINRGRSDNRIVNLREVTHAENCRNFPISKRNSSGVVGVSFDRTRNKWKASIHSKNLGRFDRKEDAIMARKDAENANNYHENHGKDL